MEQDRTTPNRDDHLGAPRAHPHQAQKKQPPISDRRIAFLLIIVIVSALTFGALIIWREAWLQSSLGKPPLASFIAFGIAVLALLIGQRYCADTMINDFNPEDLLVPALSLSDITRKFLGQPWRGLALATALGLSIYMLWQLPGMSPEVSYAGVFLAWGLAITLCMLAFAPEQLRARLTSPIQWTTNRWMILTLACITLLALGLRTWNIDTIPFTVSGDEAAQGLETQRVLTGGLRNPFATGWFAVPTMSFFFNSLSLRIFDMDIVGLRLPWALVGTATLLVTFLLVKQLTDWRLGLLSSVLLTTYHYHIHFSRLGSNTIADPLLMALALLFLYRALACGKLIHWILVGVVCGLTLYAYIGARLVLVVILIILGYQLIRDPRGLWVRHRYGLLIGLMGFLIVGAPMIQYALRFPELFNERVTEVGILQSGWLSREVEIRGQSASEILLDQFLRSALAFNYYPDRKAWYDLQKPLLDPFFGALFILGLGYSTIRALGPNADQRLFPFVAWWWGGTILGGMLTESPPSSQRLFSLSLPVCFFIALGVWRLACMARFALPRIMPNLIPIIAVVIFSIVSVDMYFRDYTPRRIHGGPYAEIATELAPILNELTPTHTMYFFGAPKMYSDFSVFSYLAPGVNWVDITKPLVGPVTHDLIPNDSAAVFIFLPHRIAELQSVREAFPGGEIYEIVRPYDGKVIVTLYII